MNERVRERYEQQRHNQRELQCLIEQRRGLLAEEELFQKQKRLYHGTQLPDTRSAPSTSSSGGGDHVSLPTCFTNRDAEPERRMLQEDKVTLLAMQELVLEVTWEYAHQVATDVTTIHRYIPDRTNRMFMELAEMVSLQRQDGRKAGEGGYDEVTEKLDSLQQAAHESRNVWSHSQATETQMNSEK